MNVTRILCIYNLLIFVFLRICQNKYSQHIMFCIRYLTALSTERSFYVSILHFLIILQRQLFGFILRNSDRGPKTASWPSLGYDPQLSALMDTLL